MDAIANWLSDPILTGLMIVMISALVIALIGLYRVSEKERQARLRAERSERLLAQAYAEQQKLNHIKTQFILNVNHEFRTPLAAAYSYFELLELLLEQNGQLDRSTHATYIKNALHYCSELRAMVNNMLDSIDASNYQKPVALDRCSIAEIVQSTCERNELFQQEKHRIQFYIPTDLSVQANVQYLRSIFHQLLSNAIKFTPKTAPIVIKATTSQEYEQEVCISIQDFGPGIPPEEQPSLFERFVRLKRDLAGTVRGAGLGLYISKQLVEAMQGHIWVESTGRPGEGSCFRFTLPRAHIMSPVAKLDGHVSYYALRRR